MAFINRLGPIEFLIRLVNGCRVFEYRKNKKSGSRQGAKASNSRSGRFFSILKIATPKRKHFPFSSTVFIEEFRT